MDEYVRTAQALHQRNSSDEPVRNSSDESVRAAQALHQNLDESVLLRIRLQILAYTPIGTYATELIPLPASILPHPKPETL